MCDSLLPADFCSESDRDGFATAPKRRPARLRAGVRPGRRMSVRSAVIPGRGDGRL